MRPWLAYHKQQQHLCPTALSVREERATEQRCVAMAAEAAGADAGRADKPEAEAESEAPRDLDLIDIGLNLLHRQYGSEVGRRQVLCHGAVVGVRQVVATGTSLKTSTRMRETVEALAATEAAALEAAAAAEADAGAGASATGSGDVAAAPDVKPAVYTRISVATGCDVYATAGVHPHDSKTWVDGETLEGIREAASSPRVVAIGECGLDFNRMFSPKEQQLAAFAAQVQLAVDLGLPLFVHENEAHADLMAILSKVAPGKLPPLVVHCFTGKREELVAYVEAGFYIGLTGFVCKEERGRDVRAMIPLIPRDKLLLETDGPFMHPAQQPRGERCEPRHMVDVARTVAEAWGVDIVEAAAQTSANSRKFFRLPEPAPLPPAVAAAVAATAAAAAAAREGGGGGGRRRGRGKRGGRGGSGDAAAGAGAGGSEPAGSGDGPTSQGRGRGRGRRPSRGGRGGRRGGRPGSVGGGRGRGRGRRGAASTGSSRGAGGTSA